eukprot:6025057-Prymnesium_polylepis.1
MITIVLTPVQNTSSSVQTLGVQTPTPAVQTPTLIPRFLCKRYGVRTLLEYGARSTRALVSRPLKG